MAIYIKPKNIASSQVSGSYVAMFFGCYSMPRNITYTFLRKLKERLLIERLRCRYVSLICLFLFHVGYSCNNLEIEEETCSK